MLTIGSTFGSMVGSMVGLTFSLTVGSTVGSTWLSWAINLSKAFDSSDKKLNNLVILQACFTGSSFYGLLMAINQEGSKQLL
jgi:hypothetical protein